MQLGIGRDGVNPLRTMCDDVNEPRLCLPRKSAGSGWPRTSDLPEQNDTPQVIRIVRRQALQLVVDGHRPHGNTGGKRMPTLVNKSE